MGHVIGPFIEYACTGCGRIVQENAPRNPARLSELIAARNADASTRICAWCHREREHPEISDPTDPLDRMYENEIAE